MTPCTERLFHILAGDVAVGDHADGLLAGVGDQQLGIRHGLDEVRGRTQSARDDEGNPTCFGPVEVPPGARMLYVAGQVGMDQEGKTPEDFESEADNVFANVVRVLAGAGMAPTDVIKINTSDSSYVGRA